jgi:citrate lyase subunit beta / citryl-CoA lyase
MGRWLERPGPFSAPGYRDPVERGDGLPVSYLFVPANRLDRLGKALDSGTDEVIVDLEDSVGSADKDAARQALMSMTPPSRPVLVRVNGRASEHHAADVRAISSLGWLAAVILPKVEYPEDIAALKTTLPGRVGVLALVESARGIVAAEAIADGGAHRLLFGSADYLADIGAASGREALAYPRSRLVVASRAAGLPAPVDGPALSITDVAQVRSDTQDAKAVGFGAKLCIHPAQVPIVNAVFRPSDEQIRWARAVLAVAGDHVGAFTFEGAMVDQPVLARARQLLARAET